MATVVTVVAPPTDYCFQRYWFPKIQPRHVIRSWSPDRQWSVTVLPIDIFTLKKKKNSLYEKWAVTARARTSEHFVPWNRFQSPYITTQQETFLYKNMYYTWVHFFTGAVFIYSSCSEYKADNSPQTQLRKTNNSILKQNNNNKNQLHKEITPLINNHYK